MAEEGGGTTEVAVIDKVASEVRPRAQAAATASSASAAASTGVAKRKRTGDGENESLKLLSNNSTCTQLRTSVRRRNSASATVPLAVTDNFHCLSSNSRASDSCCSSYGSSEVEKDDRFTDLKEDLGEADSSTSRFSRERSLYCSLTTHESQASIREKTLSFEIGGEEETESMNSSAAKSAEPNPPERLEEFQSSVDTVLEGLYRKVGKPEVKRPSNIEIEEFFAAAEADNLPDLNHFKNKYNFDFVKEEPLKGRFEWHRISPGGKVRE